MTKPEWLEFHEQFCKTMHEITKKKNADYTGGSVDPFANFRRVEALGICSTEQGFLTRMTDKMSRLASFVKNGTLLVKDESATDTLADLANYVRGSWGNTATANSTAAMSARIRAAAGR